MTTAIVKYHNASSAKSAIANLNQHKVMNSILTVEPYKNLKKRWGSILKLMIWISFKVYWLKIREWGSKFSWEGKFINFRWMSLSLCFIREYSFICLFNQERNKLKYSNCSFMQGSFLWTISSWSLTRCCSIWAPIPCSIFGFPAASASLLAIWAQPEN